MLEPLTNAVFTSLLSGRSFTGPHFNSPLASRMVARVVSAGLPQDFFTPHPRRVKGKERALPVDDRGMCQVYPAAASATLTEPCKGVQHLAVLRDISCRHRARRMSGRKTMHAPSRSHLPPFHKLVRGVDVLQRRHASSLLEPGAASSSSPATVQQDQWRDLITSYCSGATASDPEKIWRAYESLLEFDGCASMEVKHLLQYGARIASSAEDTSHDRNPSDRLRLWGSRLQTLVDNLAPRIEDTLPVSFSLRCRCLMVAAQAMVGDIDNALSSAREINGMTVEIKERRHMVQMYTTLIHIMHQHRGSLFVLRALLDEWDAVGTYFYRLASSVWESNKSLQRAIWSFRDLTDLVVSRVENPAAFMIEIQDGWPQKRQQIAGEFLIEILCRTTMAHEALDVLEVMQRHKIPVKMELQLDVVWALTRADAFELANTLYAALAQWVGSGLLFTRYLTVGLYLFSHQGDVPRTEEYFNRLSQRGFIAPQDRAMLMHAHAVNGDVDRVIQLFHHFFPPNKAEGDRPNIYHYTAVIAAHAKHGDYTGMNQWLQMMTEAGIAPDLYVYNIILHSFAERGEMDYIAQLLDEMRASKIHPSRESYTTLIALLAKRRDAIAAEEIYKRAVREGVTPDRRMISALMNAYVESGQWEGVVRAFDYIHSSAHRGIRLSIEVYNTLLKAYVLIGAPFRVVASLFQKLGEAGVRPEAYTFALLIQSACDSGLMEIASDLYAEMERLAENWQSSLHINVYVLTILMTGYLRKGNRPKARAVFDDMKKRGIQPSAVTFASIVKAYGTDKTGAGLQAAEQFLKSLLTAPSDHSPWMATTGGRANALQTVFEPLLTAHAQQERPQHVERLIGEMQGAGGERTLGALTALMDAHRRTGNVDAVLEIWPEIYELGLRHARVNTLFANQDAPPDLRSHGIVMCVPLSICLDALSAGGRHAEAAKAWRQLQDVKLAFDSHNWNHLIVALIRAGEPARAFEIVEDIILPQRRKLAASVSMEREKAPLTPLLGRHLVNTDLPHSTPEAPLHNLNRRASAVRTATKKSKVGMEEAKPSDFAHPLYVLAQVSPLWDSWRPHEAVMRLLCDVLAHLQSGNLVQPLRSSTDDSPSSFVNDVRALKKRSLLAGEILGKIYDSCPETVRLVRDYEAVNSPHLRRRQYRGSK